MITLQNTMVKRGGKGVNCEKPNKKVKCNVHLW